MKIKLWIGLLLLAVFVLAVGTGCTSVKANEKEMSATEAASVKTTTITLTAITGDSTTEEAILKVQEAMNVLSKSEYKTQVILQLKTADEYVAFVESQAQKIEEEIAAKEAEEARIRAEKKAKREAEKIAAAQSKIRSIWATTTTADPDEETEGSQEMTEDAYGRAVLKYPELEGTHLDIVFVTGYDMLVDFVNKGYLEELSSELTSGSKILNKYIYPTFLENTKVDGGQYAIGNNRLIGQFTYLLIDKDLAKKYNVNTAYFYELGELESFLDAVKANEPDYVPISQTIDMNYVQYALGYKNMLGSIIKGTYKTNVASTPKNLLAQERYVAHYALLDKLVAGGYVGTGAEGEKYAVQFATGDVTTPEKEGWADKYVVFEYEVPIAYEEEVFSGMFCVSSYCSNVSRCMEIIKMLNTNAEYRTTYAFGIEGENYTVNDDGTVHMLNDDWSMNFYHTGNTLIGRVPETLPADYSEIAKAQNIRSIISPYMKWKYEAEDEEAEKLLKEYLALNEKYMAEFEASTDKKQWYKDHRKEMKANEILSKQLDLTDNRTGIAYKYSDFFMENYSSDF